MSELEETERVREIARMLAGDNLSDLTIRPRRGDAEKERDRAQSCALDCDSTLETNNIVFFLNTETANTVFFVLNYFTKYSMGH